MANSDPAPKCDAAIAHVTRPDSTAISSDVASSIATAAAPTPVHHCDSTSSTPCPHSPTITFSGENVSTADTRKIAISAATSCITSPLCADSFTVACSNRGNKQGSGGLRNISARGGIPSQNSVAHSDIKVGTSLIEHFDSKSAVLSSDVVTSSSFLPPSPSSAAVVTTVIATDRVVNITTSPVNIETNDADNESHASVTSTTTITAAALTINTSTSHHSTSFHSVVHDTAPITSSVATHTACFQPLTVADRVRTTPTASLATSCSTPIPISVTATHANPSPHPVALSPAPSGLPSTAADTVGSTPTATLDSSCSTPIPVPVTATPTKSSPPPVATPSLSYAPSGLPTAAAGSQPSSSTTAAGSQPSSTTTAAAAKAPRPPQSPAYILGGGYWARFGWLPPENILYLQEAMAAEEVMSPPLDQPEHPHSWLEGGEGEEEGWDGATEDPAQMEALLRQHLEEERVWAGDAWRLGRSPLGGRFGVFASRDLRPGEPLLHDAALVLGPRAGAAVPPVCAGCHSARRPLRACPRGCGLPVCAEGGCEANARHQRECRVLVAWRPVRSRESAAAAARSASGGWSPALLRALCAVRALALPPRKRRLLRALTAHEDRQHAFEVELVRRAVDEKPCACDAAVMTLACRAFDSNAFEAAPGAATAAAGAAAGAAKQEAVGSPTGRSLDGAGATLRALYPLAAMLNHACTPNTRHGYDAEGRLRLYAAVAVAAGEELTNSYTPLLWATPARRHQLRFTKHFDCACARCADPLEGGAALSALRCARSGCEGLMLPQQPLEHASPWKCVECGARVRAREAQAVQAVLGGPLSAIDACDPVDALAALRRLSTPLPPSNHVLLELKSCLVWLLGHKKNFQWHELPDSLLQLKESLVRELLRIVDLLRAGQCRLRGLLMYELHCTLEAKLCRVDNPEGKKEKTNNIYNGDVTNHNGLDQTNGHKIDSNGNADHLARKDLVNSKRASDTSSHLTNGDAHITNGIGGSKHSPDGVESNSTNQECKKSKDHLQFCNGEKNSVVTEPSIDSTANSDVNRSSENTSENTVNINVNGISGPEIRRNNVASGATNKSVVQSGTAIDLAALAAESAAALAEAAAIFAEDVTAPVDLQQRLAAARMVRGFGGGV